MKISNLSWEKVGLTESVHDSDLYMPIYGRKDAAGYIDTPTKIIYDILENEILTSDDDISQYVDLTSYNSSQNSSGNYTLAMFLDKASPAKKLISDICKDTPLIPHFNSLGKLKFNHINNTYDPATMDLNKIILNKEDIIKLTFSRTPVKDLEMVLSQTGNVLHADLKGEEE